MTLDSRPPDPHTEEVTAILLAWGRGDRAAESRLMEAVYAELHRRAMRAMRRERFDHTLEPTALVHEAYMRLVDQRRASWQNRSQFFAIAAETMRRVLVDHARSRLAAKRGGAQQRVTLSGADVASDEGRDEADLLALNDALERLAALDPRQARLVELRYFAGADIAETATALGVSPATVKREWAVARAWLRRELSTS